MAITITSEPARVDNAAAFVADTSLSEDASHVNLRIRAELYHNGDIIATKDMPKGITSFDFEKILKSLITPYKAAMGGTLKIRGGITESPPGLISGWSDLYSNHETFTVSGISITQCVNSDASATWAGTNTLSVTKGDIIAVCITDMQIASGELFLSLTFGGDGALTPIADGENMYLLQVVNTSAIARVVIGNPGGNFDYGCGGVCVFKVPAVIVAGNYQAHYFIKFTEKYENASGVTQTGATSISQEHSYINSDADDLNDYDIDDDTKHFLTTFPGTWKYDDQEIQINFLCSKHSFVYFGYKIDGGSWVVSTYVFMGGFIGVVCLNDTTLMSAVTAYVDIALFRTSASTYPLTETIRIYKEDVSYPNSTFLQWMNKKGGLDQYQFKFDNNKSLSTSRDYYIDNDNKRKILEVVETNSKMAETFYETEEMLTWLKEILISLFAYELEGTDSTDITIVTASAQVRSKKEKLTFSVEYEY